MGSQADEREIVRNRALRLERDIPGWNADQKGALLHGRNDILHPVRRAAASYSGSAKYLLHGTVSQNPAAVHDTEPGTEMVGLIPAVCDHDSPAVQGTEEVFEFRLKLILQIAVQSGKRLVQQKKPWPAGQDSGESRSLGLPP